MDVGAGTRVEVNREECTGCGLCVESCERGALKIGTEPNHYGVYPVQQQDEAVRGVRHLLLLMPGAGRDYAVQLSGTQPGGAN